MSRKSAPAFIPPTKDLAALRDTLANLFNRIIRDINDSGLYADLDGNFHRLTRIGGPVAPHDAVNLRYLQEQLEGLGTNSQSTERIRHHLLEYTLTAASTAIDWTGALPQNGDTLSVKINQDATGGRQITWSADFAFAPIDIDTSPSTTTLLHFTGRSADGKWWLDAQPVTGWPI